MQIQLYDIRANEYAAGEGHHHVGAKSSLSPVLRWGLFHEYLTLPKLSWHLADEVSSTLA